MAETEAAGSAAKGGFDFIKTKVGPLPIGVWAVVALGIWWYFQRKNVAPSPANPSAVPNQQTDPAGNIGSIDPATGYVYGTPEDNAALASNNSSGGGSTGNGSTTAGQYATDTDWGRAAINYLVGLGIDPSTANQAIQNYLASQTLTPDQQGDVNLAIQGLGAPPQPPTATQSNPTPIVGSGGGTTTASNPPTGLTVTGTTSSTVSLTWGSVANATAYTVQYGTSVSSLTTSQTVTSVGTTIGGLTPGTTYYFQVQGTPASTGAGWAGPVSAKTGASTNLQSPYGSTTYTVTGQGSPSDQYPAGVAIAVFKLPSSDTTDISYWSVLISEMNNIQSPYPIGTVLNVPSYPAYGVPNKVSSTGTPAATTGNATLYTSVTPASSAPATNTNAKTTVTPTAVNRAVPNTVRSAS